jgi:alpha-tubulin suppressor-like RCC1 family protein
MEELRQWLPMAESATVVVGVSHSFRHLETGEVYACGNNSSGQLGVGANPRRNHWQRVPVPGVVRNVVASGYHSFLLLESGEVYACGFNGAGQLALGDNQNRDSWQRVVIPGVVRAVVAGEDHSLLLLVTGEVYACGDNGSDQLGQGNNRNRWQQVPVPGVVRTVVTSEYHTFLLLETGEVYGCGDNLNGQLGLGHTQNRDTWQRVAVPGVVRTLVAFKSHSFLLLDSGELYGCGSNHQSQLGLRETRNYSNSREWLRIMVPGPVRMVATSWYHSLLLLETGEVYGCGSNIHGQLGLGETPDQRISHEWQRVPVPGVVHTVTVGGGHSFLSLETGEVYGCGDNLNGQLGLGTVQRVSTWQLTKPGPTSHTPMPSLSRVD